MLLPDSGRQDKGNNASARSEDADRFSANVRDRYRKEIRERLAELDLTASSHSDLVTELCPDLDPQYRQACERMERLDAVLRKKMLREQEVKRQRWELERHIREELLQLEASAPASKEEAENTAKFLASHEPPATDERPSGVEPVFQTECVQDFDEAETPRRRAIKTEASATGHGRDFLRRNIELAAAHGQLVAMTTEEQARLQQLLEGVDELPDEEEVRVRIGRARGRSVTAARAPQGPDGSGQVAVAGQGAGGGYSLTAEEAQRMQAIDIRLQQLAAGGSGPQQQQQQQRPAIGQSEPAAGGRPGERALAEAQESRLAGQRLAQLNSRLASMGSGHR